ncbi:MAG: hypothetical protein ACXWXN_10440 [Actinomycetota bacterium]
MRTSRRGEETDRGEIDLGLVADDFPSDLERRVDARRRVGTLASFGVVAVVLAILVIASGDDSAMDRRSTKTTDAAAPGTSALQPGTYRLPGLSAPVSITVPAGWSAGDSIWGPVGEGLAAISTGRPGAAISIALLDVGLLHPYVASMEAPLGRPGTRAWFRRSLEDFTSRVEPRLRDRVVGHRLDWRPPPVLAWLLAFTDRGPIGVADDVTYDGRRGALVSFAFPGPARSVFGVPGGGAISLRPGVTYTFWVPRTDGSAGDTIVLGVARELGAAPTAAEWDVVRTLEIG